MSPQAETGKRAVKDLVGILVVGFGGAKTDVPVRADENRAGLVDSVDMGPVDTVVGFKVAPGPGVYAATSSNPRRLANVCSTWIHGWPAGVVSRTKRLCNRSIVDIGSPAPLRMAT